MMSQNGDYNRPMSAVGFGGGMMPGMGYPVRLEADISTPATKLSSGHSSPRVPT